MENKDPMNKEIAKPQRPGQTRQLLEPEHQTGKQRIITISFYIALALIAVVVAVFLKWSFQSENVLQVNNEPFPVRTIRENPEANGVVIIKADVCKHIEAEGELRISFVSQDREVFLPLARERSPKGCTVTEVPVLIPTAIEPGDYRVRFRVVYRLNPLKNNIADEFSSKEFHISPHLINKQQ